MKKALPVVLLFLLHFACFAQSTERINVLIKANLNKNFFAIQEEASGLNDTERLRVYNSNKMDQWTGGLVNLFAPFIIGGIANFGIGNFIQEDYLGGGITLAGNLVGGGLIITGLVRLITTGILHSSLYMIGAGAGTTVAFNLFGTIKALLYPSTYNNKLKRALDIEHLVLNIEPSLDFNSQGTHLTFVQVRF